jgi:hypothetical protein
VGSFRSLRSGAAYALYTNSLDSSYSTSATNSCSSAALASPVTLPERGEDRSAPKPASSTSRRVCSLCRYLAKEGEDLALCRMSDSRVSLMGSLGLLCSEDRRGKSVKRAIGAEKVVNTGPYQRVSGHAQQEEGRERRLDRWQLVGQRAELLEGRGHTGGGDEAVALGVQALADRVELPVHTASTEQTLISEGNYGNVATHRYIPWPS